MSELTQPWVWYGLGLAVCFVLIVLADWYDRHRLPRARANLDTLPPRNTEAPVNHEQTNHAVRLSLLMPDSRTERHNSYPLARARDERRAQDALRPRSGQVENVVPFTPRDPEGPAAA